MCVHLITRLLRLVWRLSARKPVLLHQLDGCCYFFISIPDEEIIFRNGSPVGCTASYFVKIIWCPHWFCNPPPILSVLLDLGSPKGGCSSISDDLFCSSNWPPKSVRNRCLIKVFGGVFYVVTSIFGFFCGCRPGAFVTGLSQISSFFSWTWANLNLWRSKAFSHLWRSKAYSHGCH